MIIVNNDSVGRAESVADCRIRNSMRRLRVDSQVVANEWGKA